MCIREAVMVVYVHWRHSITSLPRLLYVNIAMPLLPHMLILSTLQEYHFSVSFLPYISF